MERGRTFTYAPPTGDPVEMDLLSMNGPLCSSYAFNHQKRKVVKDLYLIYVKDRGAVIGPFFAEITLADHAMKKILKQFNALTFSQPLEWLRRQNAMGDWINKNIGKPGDLIGAEWSK